MNMFFFRSLHISFEFNRNEQMILDHHQFACRLLDIIEQNGDIYDIEKLLYKISSIDLNYLNYNGQSLIHVCCLYNRLDLLKLFVEYGQCDTWLINDDGWLPLHIAVYLGYTDIVCYLLESRK